MLFLSDNVLVLILNLVDFYSNKLNIKLLKKNAVYHVAL